jgi:ubiquinone/menaquinone biosynthesis C-methylase UbiE
MKSSTDIHWNTRAQKVANDIEVNIMDIFQRNLEYEAICPYIKKDMKVLEIGCGNGYSTSVFRKSAKFVDAFDYAEEMIKRARTTVKETNNSFFVDNVLEPKHLKKQYDLVICVRVLINLRNLKEQKLAINNVLPFVKDNGLFILVEGFKDGFEGLNEIRKKTGLTSVNPAKINYYSYTKDLLPLLKKHFKVENEIHLGAYDYLTRFVYPNLVEPDQVKHNTNFHEKASVMAGAFNHDCFKALSRIRGFVLRKK